MLRWLKAAPAVKAPPPASNPGGGSKPTPAVPATKKKRPAAAMASASSTATPLLKPVDVADAGKRRRLFAPETPAPAAINLDLEEETAAGTAETVHDAMPARPSSPRTDAAADRHHHPASPAAEPVVLAAEPLTPPSDANNKEENDSDDGPTAAASAAESYETIRLRNIEANNRSAPGVNVNLWSQPAG